MAEYVNHSVIPAPLVIPAKAGIQRGKLQQESRFVGMTGFRPRFRGGKHASAEAGVRNDSVVY